MPKIRRYTRWLLVFAMGCLLAEVYADETEDENRTVHVSVTATDSSGGILHYRWRSTDGSINNVNSPTTTWSLPPGPGLHFAYALVSNGRGGYAEQRVAVNTDRMPWARGSVGDSGLTLTPPPAPAQGNGDTFRSFVKSGYVSETGHGVYVPNVRIYLQDQNSPARFPATGAAVSNIRGEYMIPGVPPGAYDVNCSVDGTTYSTCYGETILNSATPDYSGTDTSFLYYTGNPLIPLVVTGSFLLQDGNPCGIQDELFGVHSNATATLLGAGNAVLSGPVPVNEYGDFSLPNVVGAQSIQLRCEGAAPIAANTVLTAPPGSPTLATGDGGLTYLTGVSAPVITGMSATWNGTSVGTFLPPPTGFASDVLKRSDGYLAEKGIDSRQSGCRYYMAIGAVQGCDRNGNFTGTVLSYDAWQRSVHIGRYVRAGTPQYSAAYINRADLNLARVHTSVSYGPSNTAAVVCNHLGPPAATPAALLNPPQSDIDTAVENAVHNKNLVACVAMDYITWPGVNNGQPFVRFLIFGPSGQLLPSINLDGRAEKFVPGTCVVCHGGDHYQGHFPADGSGFANIGAHFLTYDTGNFEFASAAGLKESDQEESIYNLNQNVLQAGPTVAEQELIAGWYQSGHVLNKDYIAPSWSAPDDFNATPGSTTLQTYEDFYQHVVARSCRSCHQAMIEPYNFDHEYNIDEYDFNGGTPSNTLFFDPDDELQRSICGGQFFHSDFQRDWMMPNSLVTFNRLWNSAGSAEDQVAYLNNYLALSVNIPNVGSSYACGTAPYP